MIINEQEIVQNRVKMYMMLEFSVNDFKRLIS